ncbi:hypothetical protein HanIR_Chr13g0660891 [Helianthus annuus]|nr:hypothetical protein HanIR_Chr13g0660891 [Helianthus annuus]
MHITSKRSFSRRLNHPKFLGFHVKSYYWAVNIPTSQPMHTSISEHPFAAYWMRWDLGYLSPRACAQDMHHSA